MHTYVHTSAVSLARLSSSAIFSLFTHTYMHAHSHMHVNKYACIHTCTYTYIRIHICTYAYIRIHTCTYMYIHIHTHTYLQFELPGSALFLSKLQPLCTDIHTYIHTCTYTYIRIHTCNSSSLARRSSSASFSLSSLVNSTSRPTPSSRSCVCMYACKYVCVLFIL